MLKLPFVCSLLTRNVMTLPMYQREFSMYRPCTKGSREAVLFLLILSPCPASPAERASRSKCKRLLLHFSPVACDLLPFAIDFDKRVSSDDGVRATLTHDQNVIGVFVGCDGRIAVHAHLEFGEFLAVCLDVLGVGHQI